MRFALDANDCQPIAFDWVFEAAVPPHVEERTHTRDNYRVSAELVRYHQTGVATRLGRGRRRTHRDHARHVGVDAATTRGACATASGCRSPTCRPAAASAISDGVSFEFLWSPILMERPDGSRYALWLEWSRVQAPGSHARRRTGPSSIPTAGRDDRGHRARDDVRPLEPPPARRAHHGDDGRRADAPVGRGGRVRHRIPPRRPGSTSGSTGTSTASGAATSSSTASASPTARRPSNAPAACTRSATP